MGTAKNLLIAAAVGLGSVAASVGAGVVLFWLLEISRGWLCFGLQAVVIGVAVFHHLQPKRQS